MICVGLRCREFDSDVLGFSRIQERVLFSKCSVHFRNVANMNRGSFKVTASSQSQGNSQPYSLSLEWVGIQEILGKRRHLS